MRGVIIKSTGSWYLVRDEQDKVVRARLPGKFKLNDQKISNPISVGDFVILEAEDDNFLIQKILQRRNYIIRKSPKKRGYAHMIAANIDQAVMVASHKRPRTSLGFIDRFFTTLEAFRIPGFLLINKADLYSEAELTALREIMKMYEKIGYRAAITSFTENNISEIDGWFENKITLISGHSGAGKSTLINLIAPKATQAVGEISDFANKGTHTTTFAEMFSLNPTTHIIDTPGIKELGLAEIQTAELSHYFPEMRNFLGQCKFHNCLHISEPSCAIQEAVKSGEIALSRFESYLSMMENDDNRR
ncbi:MAG: ribosome small subunit-dependent GTPase A [Flammeovirgaceae bacterium]|jgi:ribosome biogenesis GTPase / thiamine phosphate phosphatase|nr:ribosome small subunit-dependent GTPase A [Flammeovirgaceae bacterium]|tara:strand:- start:36235 stop:37146 length:912 start_codon:yes stop_codon:yes gene_type:complete